MRKTFLLFICMFFASMARAQTGTIVLSVTATPTPITVNQNCNYVVIQENSASPSNAFTITLPGQATGITYAAGTKFVFSAATNGYVNGQTLGTITVASGPVAFIGIESITTPTVPAKTSGGAGNIIASSPISASPNPIIGAGTLSCPTCVTASGGGSVSIASGQVGFGTATNQIGGSNNFLWDTVNGALSLTTSNSGSGTTNGQLIRLTNTNATTSAYIEKGADNSLVIRNDALTIPSAGYFSFDAAGDIVLQAGSNGPQVFGYTQGQGVFPNGSVAWVLFDSGIGTAKFGVQAGAPQYNRWWWDSGTGCTTWFVSGLSNFTTPTAGATACPPPSGTPNPWNWPIATATSGYFLQSDGGSPTQQTTWAQAFRPSGSYTIGDCLQYGAGGFAIDAGTGCNTGSGGANTALGNLAGVGINTTLLPASVNTVALGSTSLPFTNSFLGPSSTKYFTFGGLASLTAGRTVTIPDANTNTVQPLGSATSHKWVAYIDNTGTQNLTQPSLSDVSAGTAASGTYDFSGVTLFKARLSAGLTTSTNGDFGYDTTNKNWHFWQNGADLVAGIYSATPTNGNCVQSTVASSVVNLTDAGAPCGTTTAANTQTLTNKTINAESTGNTISVPTKAIFSAAGCSAGSTAGPALVTGSTNTPTPQCAGSTVPKGVLQFARGNAAYISSFQLPSDWNASASTDIQICFTTTDTTNGHVTSFNVQTGFNKVDGTATDDPSLNTLQAASVTTGASQVSGGQLCATLTGMTMTGSAAGYNFEVAITRNNSGTDTNTDTAVAVKYATLTFGRSMNAANR